MDTDRTNRTPDSHVEAIRTIFYENTVDSPAGQGTPWNPYTGAPCSVGELKREIGAHQRPPMSYNSVHRIVTGHTHPDAPGPIAPTARPSRAGGDGAGGTVVTVREVYRIGKVRGKRRGRLDRAVLVSRRLTDDGGALLVETVRRVTVDSDGVIVAPGAPLTIDGTVVEGNRELTEGRVLSALCDPELVLDGRPDGRPLSDTGRPAAGGDAK